MEQTVSDLLNTLDRIYRLPNDRIYDMEDFFYYEQKSILRYFESKKKKDTDGIKINLFWVAGWFLSFVNRFHFNLEHDLAKRYSYKCPFCLEMPCICDEAILPKSQKTGRPTLQQPKTIKDWQALIKRIYPNDKREKLDSLLLLKHDDLHFLFRKFRRELGRTFIKPLAAISTDYFVLIIRVLNSYDLDLGMMFLKEFKDGCPTCHKQVCECFYTE